MYRFLFIPIVLLMLIAPNQAKAQCGNDLKRECFQLIKSGTYLKDFRIRFEQSSKKNPESSEFSIMLSKGNRYRFVVKNDKTKPGEGVIKLYDDFKIYASSFDAASGTSHSAFDFLCQKTQIYYLSGHFKEGKKGCAIIMMGLMGTF